MSRVTDPPPELRALRRAVVITLRAHQVTPEQARVLRRAAETDPKALPRRHPGEGRNGWHVTADPGAYARVLCWRDRWHWLNIVVPLALDHRRGRAALSRHNVSRDTFRRWARIESLYAGDRSTGRRVIVRPDDVARLGEIGCKRTVQRCRAAARELGLYVDVMRGRHLNGEELKVARPHYTEQGWRERWSRQMGLCNESACAVPRWMPPLAWLVSRAAGGRVTPTVRPRAESQKLTVPRGTVDASGGRGARGRGAGSAGPGSNKRRRPLSESQQRAYRLAHGVTRLIPWLAATRPGQITPALHRFANASPGWTPGDVVAALNTRNRRHELNAPRNVWAPAPLLAQMLRGLDPVEDHPAPELRRRQAAAPAWCGACDRATRQVELDDGRRRRCPACHPHRLSPSGPRETGQ